METNERAYYVRLGKEVSCALRHTPQRYGLTLDRDGFVTVEALLAALNASRQRDHVLTQQDLEKVMQHSDKVRHEMRDGKIRALYGHSTKEKIEKTAEQPPALLWHGTSHSVLDTILREGIKSMKRQYVHMGADIAAATEVGARHDRSPVLLEIDAQRAYADGVRFYKGNDRIWLSDWIAPQYIRVISK